jgi:hypothetical protein
MPLTARGRKYLGLHLGLCTKKCAAKCLKILLFLLVLAEEVFKK